MLLNWHLWAKKQSFTGSFSFIFFSLAGAIKEFQCLGMLLIHNHLFCLYPCIRIFLSTAEAAVPPVAASCNMNLLILFERRHHPNIWGGYPTTEPHTHCCHPFPLHLTQIFFYLLCEHSAIVSYKYVINYEVLPVCALKGNFNDYNNTVLHNLELVIEIIYKIYKFY